MSSSTICAQELSGLSTHLKSQYTDCEKRAHGAREHMNPCRPLLRLKSIKAPRVTDTDWVAVGKSH